MKTAARFDVLFRSKRFNLSKHRDDFINPCCFGDDVAQWLISQFRALGLQASEPDQEDWGWYFGVEYQSVRYFVGVGGIADDEPAPKNQGEWRIIVEKHRTLWQKLARTNLMTDTDPLVQLLEKFIAAEPDLQWVGIE